MSLDIVKIDCPGCGAPVNISQKTCIYCEKPVIISSFNSVYSMPLPEVNKYANTYNKLLVESSNNKAIYNSIAICYLKLKLYDKALLSFEKAIEDNFDNSETFFYAAICLLKGNKAFLAQRPTINKIEEYINAATMIEPLGVHYYFLAYIKYDYFHRKFLKTSPSYEEALQMAFDNGLTECDSEQLFTVLGVAKPEVFSRI